MCVRVYVCMYMYEMMRVMIGGGKKACTSTHTDIHTHTYTHTHTHTSTCCQSHDQYAGLDHGSCMCTLLCVCECVNEHEEGERIHVCVDGKR